MDPNYTISPRDARIVSLFVYLEYMSGKSVSYLSSLLMAFAVINGVVSEDRTIATPFIAFSAMFAVESWLIGVNYNLTDNCPIRKMFIWAYLMGSLVQTALLVLFDREDVPIVYGHAIPYIILAKVLWVNWVGILQLFGLSRWYKNVPARLNYHRELLKRLLTGQSIDRIVRIEEYQAIV